MFHIRRLIAITIHTGVIYLEEKIKQNTFITYLGYEHKLFNLIILNH
jgi:hypothetical protein